MNDISILLVERTQEERTIVRDYLSATPPFHFNLTEAESLEGALLLLTQKDFDVVLLDLDLPDSSGLDTARKLITELPDTAVIVLSNPGNELLAQHAIHYGTEDYIEKRLLSSAMLVKAISYALERKKLIQEKFDVLSDLILALERIDYLESLLPICIGCKKICSEDNRWLDLEDYARQTSKNNTVRLICPDCREDINKN